MHVAGVVCGRDSWHILFAQGSETWRRSSGFGLGGREWCSAAGLVIARRLWPELTQGTVLGRGCQDRKVLERKTHQWRSGTRCGIQIPK